MVVLICGGNGFIGHHLARSLKKDGHRVDVADIKDYEYGENDYCDRIFKGDLRSPAFVQYVLCEGQYDEVYQLAADMGGAGYIFTGENDANVMHNSALINLNVAFYSALYKVKKVFYSSSACIYPQELQKDHDVSLRERDAYPANPDSSYGWEKLFSEQLYDAFNRNYNLNARIARFHNIFGPEGTFKGGKEKAPAAICRKVAEAEREIDVWGSGNQTRSFLYIDECIEGIKKLMASECKIPINIGSDEMVSINQLAEMVIEISGKDLKINNIPGPTGVEGRNSNNELIEQVLEWKPTAKLYDGLVKTYKWINDNL